MGQIPDGFSFAKYAEEEKAKAAAAATTETAVTEAPAAEPVVETVAADQAAKTE